MPLPARTIQHDKFGSVAFIKSSRARRISISMKPFEAVRVTIPLSVSFRRAEQFLLEKERWILKNLDKIRDLEDQMTVFDQHTPFSTYEHTLEIIRNNESSPKVVLKGKKILATLPVNADIRSKNIQDMIRWGIQAAWRKEAKKLLPVRLRELSGKYHLPFGRVVIKNNKSRWGSCSHQNNINLSLHLVRLPEHLVDYVLMHELVHTVHKNHSKSFWKHLEKLEPDARSLDRELKQYRIEIY